jgi:hypothetical protein
LLNKLIGAKDYSRPNMLLRKNDFKNIFRNEFDDDVINAAYETEKGGIINKSPLERGVYLTS